ncbi:hypothetical protein Salat_2959100 [Sesamum alatum]|uniref:Uncharacterized protein n=1 Tax=Sesamum alatum TaxID=300844 RepID=A0AAE2C8M3_9LAMI|nr:hypothetical protein Salat_2959100 [Sesamum alatum]
MEVESNAQTVEDLQNRPRSPHTSRYQTKPLNHGMQNMTEIYTPVIKCNTCNVDVTVDHNCDVIADQNYDVTVDHNRDALAEQNCDVIGEHNCDVNVELNCDGNVDHNCEVITINLHCVGEKSVVGHCEGVAMKAPLQCVDTGPLSPTPFNTLIAEENHIVDYQNTTECSFVTQRQVQTCTLNQAATELCSVPENGSDRDTGVL